jgi:hypothetical protein
VVHNSVGLEAVQFALTLHVHFACRILFDPDLGFHQLRYYMLITRAVLSAEVEIKIGSF